MLRERENRLFRDIDLGAMQRTSKIIPFPESHITRTESEIQFEVDTNAAKWHEYLMFQRVASSIVSKKNREEEKDLLTKVVGKKPSSPCCVSDTFEGGEVAKEAIGSEEKHNNTESHFISILPEDTPQDAGQDDYGQFEEFSFEVDAKGGLAPDSRIHTTPVDIAGFYPSFSGDKRPHQREETSHEETLGWNEIESEQEGIFILEMTGQKNWAQQEKRQ